MTPSKPDARLLFERAADRHGVFTLSDARAAGYSQPLVHFHVTRGRFERLGDGVYRLVDFPRAKDDRLAELSALLGPEAVVSHESALEQHEVSDVAPAKYHFTIPRERRYRRPPAGDVVLHTTTHPIERRDLLRRQGYTVTSLIRSILDAARLGTAPEQIALAVRISLERGLLTRHELQKRLAEESQRVRTLIERAIEQTPTPP